MEGDISADSSFQEQTSPTKMNPETSLDESLSSPQQTESSSKIVDQSIPNGQCDDEATSSTATQSTELSDNHAPVTHPTEEAAIDCASSAESSVEHAGGSPEEKTVELLEMETPQQEPDEHADESTTEVPCQLPECTDNERITSSEPNSHTETSLEETPDNCMNEAAVDQKESSSPETLVDPSVARVDNSTSDESEPRVPDVGPPMDDGSFPRSNLVHESPCASSDATTEPSKLDSASPNEPDDILGNKSLLKKVVSAGLPDTRPTRGAIATVSYELFLIDSSTSDPCLIESGINERFLVGESDVLPAIDITVQLMDRGEHALIDSDVRHCYGDVGCEEKKLPPVSTNNSYRMRIDLKLHDWQDPPDISLLSMSERLHWSDKKRQRGNFLYRRREYSTALQCYRNALKFLDTDENPLLDDGESAAFLTDRYIQVQNNLAQVYLLNSQYEQCLDAVNHVLRHDPTNVKGLFRKAKASFELGNYDQAVPPLKSLLQSQSQDVDREKVNEMLNVCEAKLEKYKKNEKEIYRRMFSGATATPQANETRQVEARRNTNWWTYAAMGSAVLAAFGIAAIIKYR